MALNRGKYKRLPDLYVAGAELTLRDGTVVWMQALNPYEMDEARHDAMVARARMVMALQEQGSDELMKVRAVVVVDGRDAVVNGLVEAKRLEFMIAAGDAIANDPEWKERLDIASRQDEILAREPSDPERKLLDQINIDYVGETNRMVDEDLDRLRREYDAMSDDAITEEYVKFYIERRGTDVALAEHKLTEVWYATRCCEGVQNEDGTWDHGACDGHVLRVFETKAEVRRMPGELVDALSDALDAVNMTVREAKNSDRQGSGSASSPLPSEQGESTPSTPDATPTEPPGSSAPPSPTP